MLQIWQCRALMGTFLTQTLSCMHVPTGSKQFPDLSQTYKEYKTAFLAWIVPAITVVRGLSFTGVQRYQSWQPWLDASVCMANHPRLSSRNSREAPNGVIFFFLTTSWCCLNESGTHSDQNRVKILSQRLIARYCRVKVIMSQPHHSLPCSDHYLHQWFWKSRVRS